MALARAGEIDAHRDTVTHHRFGAIHQPLARMQRAQCVGRKRGVAMPQAKLRQPRAFAHQHRKGLRADLGIERAVVAAGDAIEAARFVGDHAREDIEPAGRTFRIRRRDDIRRQRQALDQRHDIDAAGLQHRAAGEREFVELQFGDALRNGGAGPRQEACAHAIGDIAKAKIETRRLDLIVGERIARTNAACRRQRRDHAVGQNSVVRRGKGKRHAITRLWRRCNPMPGLTQRCAGRINLAIPWSFEPVGLQAT